MGIIRAFSQSAYRSVWTNEATEVSGGDVDPGCIWKSSFSLGLLEKKGNTTLLKSTLNLN